MKESGQQSFVYFGKPYFLLSIFFPRDITGRELQMSLLVCAAHKEELQDGNTTGTDRLWVK